MWSKYNTQYYHFHEISIICFFHFKCFSTFQIDTFIKTSSSSSPSLWSHWVGEQSHHIFYASRKRSMSNETTRIRIFNICSKSEYSNILNISSFILYACSLKLGNQSTAKIVKSCTVCVYRARFVNKLLSLNRFSGTCGPNVCIINRNKRCFVDANEILPNSQCLNAFVLKISLCIEHTTGLHLNARQANISFVNCWCLMALWLRNEVWFNTNGCKQRQPGFCMINGCVQNNP